MFLLLNILWFVWELKYVLFWLYLWQLKDYHLGRFADHFRTSKGKKLILDYLQIFKLVLLAFALASNTLFVPVLAVLFLVYFFQALLFFRSVLTRKFKKKIVTFKTIFLVAVSFAAAILFFLAIQKLKDSMQLPAIIIFDVLTPLIVSVIVLLFQPFFVAIRNATLGRAAEKLQTVKSLNKLQVIAITGSYGKTSTKEFLSTILSKKYKVLKTKEHQNSEIGVAKCILEDLKPSHEIFIAEVGAYNKGKVKEVCNMLKPKIGIVTGVNEQHLALFGSLKNLLSAEGGGELAAALPKEGLLVVNGDNKFCLDLYKRASNPPAGGKKFYSLSNKVLNPDIWADEITVSKDRISFLAISRAGDMAHFEVMVLGKQNVQNLLGAILIARELGMNFGEISGACKSILQEQAGMTFRKNKHGIDIIDSSYSSNPDGVFADLEYLKVFIGKKVIVMPCIIELGEKAGIIHEKIGRKIAEVCDLAIITSKDKFAELKTGAMDAGMAEKNIVFCDNPEDICSMATLFCISGDAILLEGRVPAELINLLK